MSCGPDRELLRLMMDDLIKQAVDKGDVQGGLKSCAGAPLDKNSNVVSCAELETAKAESAAALAKEISDREKGDAESAAALAKEAAARLLGDAELKARIDALEDKDTVVTAVELTRDNRVKLTLSDGTSVQTEPLPEDKDTTVTGGEITDNKLVLTDSDGKKVEIDLCGWKAQQPCEYHGTLQISFGGDKCGMFTRVGWGYHNDDLRDPRADVRLTDCDGRTIGWIYPESGVGHTIDVQTDKGTVIGYAMSSPVMRVWGECNKGCTTAAPHKDTAAPNGGGQPTSGTGQHLNPADGKPSQNPTPSEPPVKYQMDCRQDATFKVTEDGSPATEQQAYEALKKRYAEQADEITYDARTHTVTITFKPTRDGSTSVWPLRLNSDHLRDYGAVCLNQPKQIIATIAE